MKLFKKETDYAVRTLLCLAMQGKEDYISITALAEKQQLPLNFLRRIGSQLVSAGILETKEGVNGGVRLAKMPYTITLRKIIELFDGKMEISDCTFQKELCPNRKTCVLRRRILQIEEKLLAEFDRITLQTLIDDMNTGKKKRHTGS
ncbi:MAG: Rrf2 family transcriptional regulator [Planctomycetaceae bacterium]|jgi:Rrf2 family protein|nr:Rrf2 family transcriptional regulator [Planctomycetaceae bacterium]